MEKFPLALKVFNSHKFVFLLFPIVEFQSTKKCTKINLRINKRQNYRYNYVFILIFFHRHFSYLQRFRFEELFFSVILFTFIAMTTLYDRLFVSAEDNCLCHRRGGFLLIYSLNAFYTFTHHKSASFYLYRCVLLTMHDLVNTSTNATQVAIFTPLLRTTHLKI